MNHQATKTRSATLENRQRAWVAAEVAGDTAMLASLAHDDFALVGPLGFVLSREQWLARYANGDLVISSLEWTETTVREFGPTAVVIGTHAQRGSYRGQPNDWEFRVTQLWLHEEGVWKLATMHFSSLMTPSAARPTGPKPGLS